MDSAEQHVSQVSGEVMPDTFFWPQVIQLPTGCADIIIHARCGPFKIFRPDPF